MRSEPPRRSCMLNVTLLIHSVLLLGRETASSEADVCEEFNGGSAFLGAEVTCGRREAGETQGGARGSKGSAAGVDYST
jgi:hypothetical protein